LPRPTEISGKRNAYIIKPMDLDQFIEVVQAIESFWFMVVRLPQMDQRQDPE
jgi:hypothetical protein